MGNINPLEKIRCVIEKLIKHYDHDLPGQKANLQTVTQEIANIRKNLRSLSIKPNSERPAGVTFRRPFYQLFIARG
jgi:hypothetical protein